MKKYQMIETFTLKKIFDSEIIFKELQQSKFMLANFKYNTYK